MMAWTEQKTLENWILKASSERFSCGIHFHSLWFFSSKMKLQIQRESNSGVGRCWVAKGEREREKLANLILFEQLQREAQQFFFIKDDLLPSLRAESSNAAKSEKVFSTAAAYFFTISFAPTFSLNQCERWTVENWKFNLFNARFSSQFLVMS